MYAFAALISNTIVLKISSLKLGFLECPNRIAVPAKWIVFAILHEIRVFPLFFVWLDDLPLSGISIANRSCIEMKKQSCCRSDRARFRHRFQFAVRDSVKKASRIRDGEL
jgi:hypothetical protein